MSRPRLAILLVAIGVLVVGLAAWRWRTPAEPPLLAVPTPDLSHVEPGVRQVVAAAVAKARQSPNDAAARGLLGKVLEGNGFTSEADDCFEAAARLDPVEPRWIYLAAAGRLRAGRPADALAGLRRAAELVPDGEARVCVRLRLAETLVDQGQPDEAEALLAADPPTREPHASRARLLAGSIAADRGDWPTATGHFRACLASPFTRQKAAAHLAVACRRFGDSAGADAAAEAASRPPADFPWVDPYVSECLKLAAGRQQRYKTVEELTAQGRLAEALAEAERVAATEPDALSLTAVGMTRAKMGRFADAEVALRAALELEPDRVQALYFLGAVLFEGAEQGRASRDATAAYREAANYCRRVLALKADHGFARCFLGKALRRLGDKVSGLTELRAAVHARPEFVDLHLDLAAALAEDGFRDEALAVLADAERLSTPGDGRAAKARERLAP